MIEMLLEAGQRVQSIDLIQRSEDGKTAMGFAMDFTDYESTKELIGKYLHKSQ